MEYLSRVYTWCAGRPLDSDILMLMTRICSVITYKNLLLISRFSRHFKAQWKKVAKKELARRRVPDLVFNVLIENLNETLYYGSRSMIDPYFGLIFYQHTKPDARADCYCDNISADCQMILIYSKAVIYNESVTENYNRVNFAAGLFLPRISDLEIHVYPAENCIRDNSQRYQSLDSFVKSFIRNIFEPICFIFLTPELNTEMIAALQLVRQFENVALWGGVVGNTKKCRKNPNNMLLNNCTVNTECSVICLRGPTLKCFSKVILKTKEADQRGWGPYYHLQLLHFRNEIALRKHSVALVFGSNHTNKRKANAHRYIFQRTFASVFLKTPIAHLFNLDAIPLIGMFGKREVFGLDTFNRTEVSSIHENSIVLLILTYSDE